MRFFSIIAAAWLMVLSQANAQTTNQAPPASDTPPPAASIASSPTAARFSEAEERKAWILALRKFAEAKEKDGVDWQSIANTVAGGLLTGMVTFVALYFTTKNERDKMRIEAETKARESSREAAVAYANQLQKQVETLLGPLHSYLQQSRGIYQKIETQLIQEDSANYRRVSDPEQGQKMQLRVPPDDQGRWEDFRLLDQIPSLRQKPLYRPLLDEILRIGEQMTNLIQQHGGMLHDNVGVSDVYGEYLAHFAILKNIYLDQGRGEAYPPGKHTIGYYPRRLNNIVKQRYEALLAELKPYQEANKAALAELHQSANSMGRRKTR
jgi:hypothetical protein